MLRRSWIATLGAALVAQKPHHNYALLNHFFVTVNSATYKAIEASALLKEEFAPFEQRTTVRNDSTYSGLYFYGDSTYFEFFEENTSDRKPGDAGVALGLPHSGGSDWLRETWQKLRPSVTLMVTRQLDGKPIDWFRNTSFQETRADSAVPGLRVFAMEYAPGFARAWTGGAIDSIDQGKILEGYCRKLNLMERRNSCLMKDVATITIGSPEAGVRVRAEQLRVAGWTVREVKGGMECRGPNATVQFQFAAKPQGVTQIEFDLKRSFRQKRVEIGGSVLEAMFGGKRLRWRFTG